MSLQGSFSTMSMPDVIQWARSAQRTGLLVLRSDEDQQITAVFRDGRVVLSSNSSRRETFSRYLVYRGHCTQADIDAALEIQKTSGILIAQTLVESGKLTYKQAISALTEKTFEDFCQVFLWKEGHFTFEMRNATPESYLQINVDPIHVVMEGVRRADIWPRMNTTIHPSSYFEWNRDALFPPDGEWEDAAMVRQIRPLLDGTRSVEDLLGIFPYSRFKIWRAVDQMLNAGVIHRTDITNVVDRNKRLKMKMKEADDAVAAGNWTQAMEILQGLSAAYPGREDLLERIVQVTEGFRKSVFAHNFVMTDVPVATLGPDALSHVKLDPTDAFILSRIDGRMSVREILRITPVPENEALRSFKRLLTTRVIDFPGRTQPDRPVGVAGAKEK